MKEILKDMMKALGELVLSIISENPLEFFAGLIFTPVFITAIIIIVKVFVYLENLSIF